MLLIRVQDVDAAGGSFSGPRVVDGDDGGHRGPRGDRVKVLSGRASVQLDHPKVSKRWSEHLSDSIRYGFYSKL